MTEARIERARREERERCVKVLEEVRDKLDPMRFPQEGLAVRTLVEAIRRIEEGEPDA